MVIVVVEDVNILIVSGRSANVRSATRGVVNVVQRKGELITFTSEDECPVGVAIAVGRVCCVAVEDIVRDRRLRYSAIARGDELTTNVLNDYDVQKEVTTIK